MFHSFFLILQQSRVTYLSFHFPSELFCGPPGQQSRQFYKFSFFLLIIIRYYYYYYYLLLQSFPHQLMVFHRGLSDSKSPQVSRTRLRILAVLSKAVVWIVSTHLLTSKSSRPLNNPLVIVPKAPITIGTIVTFMFHSFFNSLARSRYLSFFSLSFHSFIFTTTLLLNKSCSVY